MRRDDVLYCALPLYHINALTVSWSAMLGAGCMLALGRKFSATRFWDEIRRVDATAFCYTGELCRYLLNRTRKASAREHRVRLIICNCLRAALRVAFQQDRIRGVVRKSVSVLLDRGGCRIIKITKYLYK